MATIETLQTWLSQAETARQNLAIGSLVEELSSPDGTRVRYAAADIGKLDRYIASLRQQIVAAAQPAARGPITFQFFYD
jgi:hypothetical protein